MTAIKSRGRVALVMVIVLLICLRFDALRLTVLPALTALLGALGIREFHRMARNSGAVFSLPLAMVLGVGIVLAGMATAENFSYLAPVLLAGGMIVTFTIQMNRYGIPGALSGVSAGGFALLYIALPLALTLQVLQYDRLFLFFGLVLIWTADSGAYFVGRKWGRTKMAPNLSPKKTVEGLIGGVIACCLVAAIFKLVTPDSTFHYPMLHVVILGAIISVLSVAGDLAESVLKRDTGVKDSGRGMGGHGGVLDRIDSMLFCMPAYYAYLRFFIWPVMEA